MRWLVIGGCGAGGLYEGVVGIQELIQMQDVSWAFRWLIFVPATVVATGLLWCVAFLTFVRKYRPLCLLLASVAALAVFCCITAIPEWLGLSGGRGSTENEAALTGGDLAFLPAAMGGWYGARWVYRRVLDLLARWLVQASRDAR